jgi:hypothetical protein
MESQLKETGYDQKTVQDLKDHVSELVDDFDFFQDQIGGLAIFLTPVFMKLFKVAFKFKEAVHLSDSFELRPLLQAFQNGHEFYVIALSRQRSRLFHANKYSIVELELHRDVPTSYEEAMRFDKPEDHLQHQTISHADGGTTPVYHGHTESDQEKKNLSRFFSQLDAGILEAVADHEKPFLLVGLEYLQPIYTQASNLPNLMEAGVDRNPDEMRLKDLHQQAWEVIEESLDSEMSQAVSRYQQLLGSEKSSQELTEITLAAAFGRIDTLLVARDAQARGRVNPEKNEVILEEAGEQDLVNYSVQQTLSRGGEVYVFDKAEMPSRESPAVAILRY